MQPSAFRPFMRLPVVAGAAPAAAAPAAPMGIPPKKPIASERDIELAAVGARALSPPAFVPAKTPPVAIPGKLQEKKQSRDEEDEEEKKLKEKFVRVGRAPIERDDESSPIHQPLAQNNAAPQVAEHEEDEGQFAMDGEETLHDSQEDMINQIRLVRVEEDPPAG